TPESTLLVVLPIVTLILTLLLLVGARQAEGRPGAWLWVLGFAMHPLSQLLRQFVMSIWGHAAGLPFGHVGGAVAYGLVYVGTRRWFGLTPRKGFVLSFCVLAVVLSSTAASYATGFISLALTTCITALFQGLCALTFWEAFRREGGVVRVVAAVVFLVSALASMLRAQAIVPAWHDASSLLPANAIWLVVFIALGILQAGCLLNLINQSLLDQLRRLADFDALTGLLNRGGLARCMHQRRARNHGKPTAMAMLCLDLDHFKNVNDTHGHGAGDDVLRGIGLLLQEHARPTDLASRSGGEEFGLVVDTDSEQYLLEFAEHLRSAVESAPFGTRAGPIPTTVSIGAAFARGGEETRESLWERADLALLEAKRTGRNRVVIGARSQVTKASASDPMPA
ncbi:MAG: GGDEF domain-containing protein, partial [Pseudomonadota bacterium]|nr:GGDEF domain-containing protein [Pseudomonadota bacterium]